MVRLKQSVALAAATTTLALVSSASPVQDKGASPLPLRTRVVTQFPAAPPGTWIENIAARANGDLLLTVLSPSASLYGVTDPTSEKPAVELLHTFGDGASGLVGIAEPAPELFVVAGYGAANSTTNTTAALVWTVDFRGVHGHDKKPEAKLVKKLDGAGVLNGVAALPGGHGDAVLVADSSKGLVWRVDIKTGAYEVAVQVAEMSGSGASGIGVNGIHATRDGFLYWTNSAARTIYRLRITPRGSAVPYARVEVVAAIDAIFLDDFAIGDDGTIFVATNFDNRLIAVQAGTNRSVVVAGSNTEFTVAGDTAAVFGRGTADRRTLYVSTTGGLGMPVNGTLTEGGKVVAVDTTAFRF